VVITTKEIFRLRKLRGVVSGHDSIASTNYGLLTGEIYQSVAKRILHGLTIQGRRVRDVVLPPKLRGRIGKRVDDWQIITSRGPGILAEVKASRNLAYFDSAFRQIRNMGGHGLFMGFWLGGPVDEPKKVLVLLVEPGQSLDFFRRVVREMANA
jgi:hypothetical protein